MLKIIIKNLWQRRRQNAWLFIELIIVTVLTWIIVDPTVVGLYDMSSSLGYDADRIVRVSIKTYPKEAENYDADHSTPEATEEAYAALRAKAARLPKVEMSSHLSGMIDDHSTANQGFRTGNEAIDSLVGAIYAMQIQPGESFFTFYGIESTDGSPTAEQLDEGIMRNNDIVITESVDRAYWPNQAGVKGKRFLRGVVNGDTIYTNVIAVVKDFRYHAATRTGAVVISPELYDYRSKKNFQLALRLSEGIDADDYVREYSQLIRDELRTGNCYVSEILSQRGQIRKIDGKEGTTSRRNLHFFVAALFLINLIVGVTGCVWLQTGKRVAELGVLRSYGASRPKIIKMLIGESVVMAIVAYIIGVAIYFQYALKEGLSIGNDNNSSYIEPANIWVNNFGEHFAIVSAIVGVIIIACVIIGTCVPALHASRIEPVDALRDE